MSKRPTSRDRQIERTRDRVTQRTVSVFHDLIGIAPDWKGIKSLIKVERVGTRAGKKYHEIVCYISSLIRTAAEFADGIRGHWGIENRRRCLNEANILNPNSDYVWGDLASSEV
jgi:predicted transposase YbfD/YdcC